MEVERDVVGVEPGARQAERVARLVVLDGLLAAAQPAQQEVGAVARVGELIDAEEIKRVLLNGLRMAR